MLRRGRHWRRNGQVKAGVKSDRLIHDSHVAIETLELTAQLGEATCHCNGIIDVAIGLEEAIECGLNERGLCSPHTRGCSCQPRSDVLAKMDASPGFHGNDSLRRDERGRESCCKPIMSV